LTTPKLNWFTQHKHVFLIAAATLLVVLLFGVIMPSIREPRNLYRILIACPQGNVALGPRNVTDAVIGDHADDRGVVELWVGLSQNALTQLVALSSTSTEKRCNALLGEMATVNIDLTQALSDDVLTINEVPIKFAERFVAAFE